VAFIIQIETVDGLQHMRVYAKGTPPRLVAWAACTDTDEGRAAIEAIREMTPAERPRLPARVRPAGQ